MIENISRRGLLGGAAALAAAVPGMSVAFERDGNRKVMVFSGNQAVPVLDPHVRYDWSTRMIQQVVYDALLKYEGDPPVIKPWLAERHEVSDDGLTYTFHLVGNAKFHNGDAVDAEAVRFSFERGLKLNAGIAWMLKDFLKPEKIAAVDARTVRFTLERPFSPFLSYVPWWYIVNPRQVMANQDGDDLGRKWMTENDAGSGPFKLRRFNANTLIHVEAVPDYWKGWPMPEAERLSGIIYRIIRESAPRKAALQRREADIITNLTPDDIDQMARLPGVAIENHKGSTTFGIKFNCQTGPTADINLRKAIAHAFDYESLLTIHNGAATLMTSPFPASMAGHIDVPGVPRKDLEKAREYLRQSGTPNGGIELEYVHVQGLEDPRRIGLALLDSLRALDIRVNIVGQPWTTMVSRGSKPDTSPAMMSIYVTPVGTDPDTVAYQYHRSSWGLYYGTAHYENAEVTRMIDEARGETDQAKRMALYAEIQRRIVADQPEIFGMVANRIWARRDYVQGFSFSPVRFTGEIDLYPLWVQG
ncbi:ABC transporter substrate-binding protein [Falsiroseomonas sp. E2-1-a20]|uniref:ABC transporter substrate-binding protein n=1 Tax=Falsiroseomonas sp. E2-1-a20 TaxID=3239300 RepID=UPI003F3F8790